MSRQDSLSVELQDQLEQPPIVSLLGVPLHNVTAEEVLERMSSSLARHRGGWILTPNLTILQRLVASAEYRALCAAATLRLPDGMPLVWASRLRGTPLRERVAGSDMIWRVSQVAARNGWSLYFLGGNPGAAEAAARTLMRHYPGFRIAGTECPPMGFERDLQYMAELRERLRAAAPDVCFVALSGEKQDRVIRELMEQSPQTWFMGIGISFSFVSGEIRRAPVWLQRLGMEWLHRLCQEPRRLGRRYLVDGIPFAMRLLLAATWEGMRGASHQREPRRRLRGARGRWRPHISSG
jgi:N-acetylglucosaminyldiphosphoundecaprenol N-acetyl-beta-D-mannosaminyltransferase